MEKTKIKTNFKKTRANIFNSIKEKIANEINTIGLSVIISLIVALTVCIPAKDFMFKEHEYVFGFTYKTLLNLQYQIVPTVIVIISSFLIGYIFNKEYIRKLQYFKKHNSKHSFTIFDYIFRIVVLSVFLGLISKYIINPEISTKISNDEEMMIYLYKGTIMIGALLTIISSYAIFWGVNNNYSTLLSDSKKEELNKIYSLKFENLNKKYTDLFEKIINKNTFTYDNSEIREFFNDEKTNDGYNLLIKKDSNTLSYQKTRDFIKYNTNEGKYFDFKNQIDCICKKFDGFKVELIEKYFNDFLATDLCSESIGYIRHIESQYLNKFDDSNLNSYILDMKKDLENSLKLSKDINEFVISRFDYLNKSYENAKKGYEGELRVEEELNKYKDHIINIPNKCFNFKYIDFIQEGYTMECDNILITKRGVFIIETKNYGEDSVHVNETTGDAYNKYIIHIESDGRWVIKYRSGKTDVIEKTPVEQNRDHILKLEKILNYHLGYDSFNENYIEVKGIIVMANKNIEIKNDLSSVIDVCRPDAIFETVMKYPKNPLFTKEKINKIIDIIKSYKEDIHKPNVYNLVDVNKELNNLECQLKNEIANRDYYDNIREILKSYSNDLQDLTNEFSEDMNNIKNPHQIKTPMINKLYNRGSK